MAGIKKDPNKKYKSSWGGSRKGAGKKLTSTNEFKDIYDHMKDKYKLEPIETHFKILDDLREEDDALSIKLKQASANALIQKKYPNPTETFEDEDGNTYFPGSVEAMDDEIANLLKSLGIDSPDLKESNDAE